MFDEILIFFSHYLIEFMGTLLVLALIFRGLSYRSSKYDDIYFSTFTREIDKCLDEDKKFANKVNNVDDYLENLLRKVGEKLPTRSLRIGQNTISENDTNVFKGKKIVKFRDYIGGQKTLINSINTESSAFKSLHPPNYYDLTNRILDQDTNWVKLFGVIPIDGISRMIDILPGLFVVFGVFGTFIGISKALPEIARIDFNNLEASGEILSSFVTSVTFSMNTSIAGIFFSLILTFLNTMYPIKGIRNQTFKKVSNSFEAIWFSIHGNASEERQMNRTLAEILKTIKNINKKMDENSDDEEIPLKKGA